ncbi:mast cell immunoglobulin like receptor 1 [Phyllostomus discolor]|nr:mast cell immunoglobulin like receptor 1 [Phyllostomus discolor]
MHWDISSSVTSEARIPSSRSQTTMWRKRVFLLLFSLSTLKAELNSEQMEKTNKLTSPILNSETNIVMKGQNVSIICSSQSKLSPITYSLFRDKNCIGTQDSKGEHVTFNLRISEASDMGPYKCKAQVPSCIRPNCTRYSHEFNFTLVGEGSCPFCLQLLLPVSLLVLFVTILILAFWTLSKYKARKARRDKAPKDYGNTPMEVGLYANVCENPGETKSSQEIHYATPLFQKVTPQNHEACNKGKTEYIYSEIIL